MEKSPRPAQLETTIREIIHELLEMPVTPHVRELRAKAVTYGRVINNWSVYAPTAPQVQAMLECVTELHEKVFATKREVSRITRRPSTSGMKKVTTPPLVASTPTVPPPGVAWNASVAEPSGIHARGSSKPVHGPSEPVTRPPPAGTLPPASAQRPVDTPTPALLRSRRSR